MTLRWDDIAVRLGGRRVLEGVTLEARPGEVLALVGPNGAGKSTLLRTAVGLVAAEQGRVSWQGLDLGRSAPRARARRVGFVPQRAELDRSFLVREVVGMGRYAHLGPFGEPGAADLAAIERALEVTGLGPLADRRVDGLSGGEAQRVLLARVLAQAPEAYLLDEPTANLDLGQAQRVVVLLRGLADAGHAVVAVLHDLEAAARVADRVALLAAGRLVAAGPPEDTLTAGHLGAAYGIPVSVRWTEGEARIRTR